MSKTRLIVYVASSVTLASQEYRNFINAFKDDLRIATEALVIEWIEKDAKIELDDFFTRDLNNVRMCDVMIAMVDDPSIGVGMEIMDAIHHKKPLLCLHKEGHNISRLLLSAEDSAGVEVETYHFLHDAVRIAADFIASVAAKKI